MKSALATLAAALVIAGCASFPVNPPLTANSQKPGYAFEPLRPGPNNTDELFVILTFSGGGTRAAKSEERRVGKECRL